MRSKASFRGHPSHPALIPLPIGFLLGALIFNVLGVWLGDASFWTAGAHLAVAGVIAGVIAAVPGAIDYVYTVPPNSTGKQRATKHAVVNVSALALFGLSRWLRGDAAAEPDVTLLGMEAVGAGLLMAGGWMGGTLVSRNQISVDHRYANAGKWSEEKHRAPKRGDPLRVTPEGLGVDQMRLLRVGGKRIVLGRTEDGFVAFDDRCTHRGGSLAGGVMMCGTVHCPWHGSQFDVATGAVEAGPAIEPIKAYRVEESDNGALEIYGLG